MNAADLHLQNQSIKEVVESKVIAPGQHQYQNQNQHQNQHQPLHHLNSNVHQSNQNSPSNINNNTSSSNNSNPTATSLGGVTRKFIDLLRTSISGTIHINDAAEILDVPRRRIYDITNVLEGIGLIEKKSTNFYIWKGPTTRQRGDERGVLKEEVQAQAQAQAQAQDDVQHELEQEVEPQSASVSATATATATASAEEDQEVYSIQKDIEDLYKEGSQLDIYLAILKTITTNNLQNMNTYCTQDDLMTFYSHDPRPRMIYRHRLYLHNNRMMMRNGNSAAVVALDVGECGEQQEQVQEQHQQQEQEQEQLYQEQYQYTVPGRSLIPINAPPGSTMEVTHPSEGCLLGTKRYELRLSNETAKLPILKIEVSDNYDDDGDGNSSSHVDGGLGGFGERKDSNDKKVDDFKTNNFEKNENQKQHQQQHHQQQQQQQHSIGNHIVTTTITESKNTIHDTNHNYKRKNVTTTRPSGLQYHLSKKRRVISIWDDDLMKDTTTCTTTTTTTTTVSTNTIQDKESSPPTTEIKSNQLATKTTNNNNNNNNNNTTACNTTSTTATPSKDSSSSTIMNDIKNDNNDNNDKSNIDSNSNPEKKQNNDDGNHNSEVKQPETTTPVSPNQQQCFSDKDPLPNNLPGVQQPQTTKPPTKIIQPPPIHVYYIKGRYDPLTDRCVPASTLKRIDPVTIYSDEIQKGSIIDYYSYHNVGNQVDNSSMMKMRNNSNNNDVEDTDNEEERYQNLPLLEEERGVSDFFNLEISCLGR